MLSSQGGCRGGSYGWQVQPKRDGYLVLVSLPSTFSVSLQDLQLIADVNPLRIDSIMVRNPENRNQYSAVVAEGEEAGSVDEGDADAKVEAEAGGAGAGEDRFGTGGSRKRKSGSEEAPADLSKGKKPKSGGPGSAGEPLCSQIRHRAIGGSKGWNLGAVIAVKVLDQSQPVRITEAEVVRVKKRHRGFFQRMLMGD